MTTRHRKNESIWRKCTFTATTEFCLVFLLLIVLPSASPFATAAVGGATPPSTLNGPHSPTALQANKLKTTWRRIRGSSDNTVTSSSSSSLEAAATTANGEYTSNFLSRLFFFYVSPLINKASPKDYKSSENIVRLDESDAFVYPDRTRMDRSVPSLGRIYKYLHKEQQAKAASGSTKKPASEAWLLTKSLYLHQRRILLLTGVLRFLNTAIQAAPSVLVARLLKLIEAGTAPGKAMQTAVMLVLVLTLKMTTENQYFHYVVKGSTQLRGALSGLIFDKSLRLPGGGSGVTYQDKTSSIVSAMEGGNKSSANATDVGATKAQTLGAGGVLNLMQTDTSLIEGAAVQLHTAWDGPLQISVYTYLLYQYLGPSVFYGIAVMLLTIPLNSFALRILNRLSKYENEAKDARTKRTAESISNMKLLKLQGWENFFADDIRKHRREELRRHVSRGAVRAVNNAISNTVPALVLVATLSAYARTGQPIVASTIFTAISLFNQLRFPLFFYPMFVDALANGRNAVKRVSTFLAAEEMVSYTQHLPPIDGGGLIELRNGNFMWSSSVAEATAASKGESGSDKLALDATKVNGSSAVPKQAPALVGAKLTVNSGEVMAVVGGVGSGKSALIKALLGELSPVTQPTPQVNGVSELPQVTTHGKVAYCSQESWLPKGTLRDAVVFGREYDEARYNAALYDAGLDRDIIDNIADTKNLKQGQLSHDTDVGEGGSSLSGGQRARVALARALYAGEDTKVFLLDDCLAALDARVGSIVFERLTARLRKSKAATVLVTNDPNIPRRCDRVVLMGKVPSSNSCSSIIDVGTFDELIDKGHDIRTMSKNADKLRIPEAEHTNGAVEASRGSNITNNDFEKEHDSMSDRSAQVKIVESTVFTHHADPEDQKALQNCPDYAAEHMNSVNHQLRTTNNMTLDDGPILESSFVYNSNETVGAPTAENKVEKVQATTTKKLSSADDAMTTGAVPFSIYLTYFKSVKSLALVVAMMVSFGISNSAQFFQQYTVAKWTEVSSDLISAVAPKYLRSLVNAAGVVSISLWIRSMLSLNVGTRASNTLHADMLSSVFAAPMSFFDATPSGQLLSRFGKEMETIDRSVPESIGSVLWCFLHIGLSVGALAGVVTPIMMIPLVVVSFLYVKVMKRFRRAVRDMKRAETKTRSPVFTHFGEALRGYETIRSVSGSREYWSHQHRSLLDRNIGVYYTVKSFDRWLSTRLETLGNMVVFTAAIAAVLLTRTGKLKAGSAGWGLTQALSVTGLLTWAVRCLTELETNMMSVLRVQELTDMSSQQSEMKDYPKDEYRSRMPKEKINGGEAYKPLLANATSFTPELAPADSKGLLHDGWPWCGNVQFKNVSMRYSPSSPLVLKNVNIAVPAGSTLGVVGRTGSGKSSLLLTLFRLVEVEGGGSIEIDGVDIRSINLQSLRQKLAIIPQEPVLFAGSVAYNLDATGQATEADMWEALQAASPSLAVQFRQGDGLQSTISEGGKNLSLGQRQLICLARALLRKSKILVLDEATSSVDSRTDQEVQETIRREFVDKGVTVITVAHRLDTVLGYDRIAVLGAGKVLEHGSPSDLLRIPNGELRSLVEADRRSKKKGGTKPSNATLVTAT